MRFIGCLLVSILVSFQVFSQLETTGGIAPANLVQDILVGNGVTVTNVQYTGSAGAIGRFSAANTSLGFANGIIMTTGTVNSGPQGPYGPNDLPNAGLDNNAPGYQRLSNIVGNNTFNAAVLEFDFVPQSDSVVFEYIFGSDEYPEWVGDQFNDVFAFFISGPGIQGEKNIALIPGTNQAVAINNVNNGDENNGPCTNCQFYVNNGTGNNAPFNQDDFYIQYDGLTTPLKASANVQCGETYHLIIAVADVADAIWDSGIFLSANSLSSMQPVAVDYQLSGDPFNDNKTMVQGCTSAKVTVTRSGEDLDKPLSVPVEVGGTAIEGVDYSEIPDVINFAANETEVTFTIDALIDGDFDDIVTIILSFLFEDPCGNEEVTTIELQISPVDELEVEIIGGEVECEGDKVELIADVSGGDGGYTYLWSTGENTSTIVVSPDETEAYTLRVVDSCINEVKETEFIVEVPDFEEIELDITEDIEDDCPYVPHDLTVDASGGAGDFKYEWTDESGNVISNSSLVTVSPDTTTTYTLNVVDRCGERASGEVIVTILSDPLVTSVTSGVEICPGDSILLEVEASGGFGDYHFYWPALEDSSSSVYVSPNETTIYKVIISDDCQTFQIRDEAKVIVVAPEADFQITTEDPLFNNLPITFQNLTNNGAYYEWFFGDGNTSTQVHPNHTYDTPGSYPVTLIAEDEKGCLDTITKMIELLEEFYLYIPNTFTPREDINNLFTASTVNITELSIEIYNRWGERIYESNDVDFIWDGFFRGRLVRNGVYPWKISYRTVNNEEDPYKIEGFITVAW